MLLHFFSFGSRSCYTSNQLFLLDRGSRYTENRIIQSGEGDDIPLFFYICLFEGEQKMQYPGNFAGISDKLTTKLVILRGKVFTVSPPKFTKNNDFGVVVPPGSKILPH